ncbi:hypothetical protein ABZ649_04750 [Streptomyces albidoflavus]|uniref:hypothetical protein n=1 Tax=Streptomyces albidoflavus TaxID=1886 RepID=UPI0033DB6B27
MNLAPMPNHNRTRDPYWLHYWVTYRDLITPLRYLGLATDIELVGGEANIVADLPDGSHILIASEFSLPEDRLDVAGWMAKRQHIDNPTVDQLLYDSTEGGPEEAHENALQPLLSRLVGRMLTLSPSQALIDRASSIIAAEVISGRDITSSSSCLQAAEHLTRVAREHGWKGLYHCGTDSELIRVTLSLDEAVEAQTWERRLSLQNQVLHFGYVKSVGYWAGFPVVAVITGDVIHTINSGDTP